MRVMYWNCTSPSGEDQNQFKQAKCAFIGARVSAFNPDILCLDEMSTKVSDEKLAQVWATTYLVGAHVQYEARKVTVNDGAHMNTVIFVRHDSTDPKITIAGPGLPSDGFNTEATMRDLLRAQYADKTTTRLVSIWFLHANASRSGGKAAVANATKFVAGKSNDIIMGDFNNDITSLDNTVLANSPSVGKNSFTQWKRDNTKITPPKYQEIYNTGQYLVPNAMIDFAISKAGKNPTIKLTAVDSLGGLTADRDGLGFLLLSFDHFPVVYDITTT